MRRPEGENRPRRIRTARGGITVVLTTLVVAMFLDSDQALTAAQGIDQPVVRTVMTHFFGPIDAVSRALHLHAPRQALEAALGKDPTTTTADDPNGLDARADAIARKLAERERDRDHGGARGSSRNGRSPHEPPHEAPPGTPEPDPHKGSKPTGPPMPHSRYVRIPDFTVAARQALHARRPLRILVTGDSTAYEPGWSMTELFPRSMATVQVASYTGTGLLRPDAFDWRLKALSQARSFHPDLVLVFMGPNDFYPIDGVNYPSPKWATLYAAHIQAVMQAYQEGGAKLVLWAPPAIDGIRDKWMPSNGNAVIREMHQAVDLAAGDLPDSGRIDMYDLYATSGRFADSVRDPVTGRTVAQARREDGTHLTMRGGSVVAHVLGQWLGQLQGSGSRQ